MTFAVSTQTAERFQQEAARHKDRPGFTPDAMSDELVAAAAARNGHPAETAEAHAGGGNGAPRPSKTLREVWDSRERETLSERLQRAPRRRVAWDVRLVGWAVSKARLWLQRAWRASHWSGRTYIRGRSLAVSHVGGLVSEETFEARMATCGSCRHKVERKGRPFCRSCGCGFHRLADLRWKNRLAFWSCPVLNFGRAVPWWRRKRRQRDG